MTEPNEGLEEKIEAIKSEMGRMSVFKLAFFDVKTFTESETWNWPAKFKEKTIKRFNKATKKGCQDPDFGKFKRFQANNESYFLDEPLSPWELMNCYKIAANELGFDCDVSLWCMVVYKELFDFLENGEITNQDKLNNKYMIEDGNAKFIGDTMNSYATTVRQWARKYPYGDDGSRIFRDWKRGEKKDHVHDEIIYHVHDKYSQVSSKATWEACILDNMDLYSSIAPAELTAFVSVVHTIGNFLPVPEGFNQPRGLSVRDYWDVTLLAIYKWFKAKEEDKDSWLEPVFVKDNNVKSVSKWLESHFPSWDAFVERNYLQDFVNDATDECSRYGAPKELWEGHFAGKEANEIKLEDFKTIKKEENILPAEIGQCEQFFSNATVRIMSRSVRMSVALKKKLCQESCADQAD